MSSPSRRTTVILNPAAGGGSDAARVRGAFAEDPDVTVRETGGPGDGSRLAREAVEAGASRIVVVGGDGTLHEVVAGLAPDFARCRLGLVPMGTGNDTARSLGVPLDPMEAVRGLASREATAVDLVEVGHRGERGFVVNAATGGWGGTVNEAMPEELKERWGPLAYARAAASAVAELEAWQVSVTVDGGPEESYRALSLVVGNGAFAGRGIRVAPGARMDDGLLSVHLIREAPTTELLALVPTILLGEVPERDSYRSWSCEEVLVRAPGGLSFSVDGEPLEAEELRFRVLPGALRFVGARPEAAGA